MDIDKETKKQYDIGLAIQTLLSNTRKDPSSRKTEEYICKRRKQLEELWNEFTERHSRILTVVREDHDYITRGWYKQVHLICMELEDILKGAERALRGVSPLPRLQSGPVSDQEDTTSDSARPFTGALGQRTSEPLTRPDNSLVRKQVIKMRLLTKLITDLRQQLETAQSASYIEYKKTVINTQWMAVMELHETILIEDSEEARVNQMDAEFEKIQDEVEEIMLQLHNCTEAGDYMGDKIRLPPLNIPVFNGEYHNWTAFHDLFTRCVHDNRRLSKVEKMQYLKTSVKGEATKLLHHLNISDVNYDAAWDLLNKRYNNKRLLVATYINNILQLPKMANLNLEELKKIHDTTVESLRALDNLGISTESWGPLIFHVIQGRLDRDTVRLYEESLHSPKEVPVLNEVMDFLQNRFQSLELMKGPSKREDNSTRGRGMRGREHWSAKTYHSTSANCHYCKEGHLIYICKKFKALTTQERQTYINKRELCVNCLVHKKDIKCKSNKTCSKCNRFHHTLLHHEKKEERKPTTVSANVSTRMEITHTSTINNPVDVLLATALVKVKTYEGSWELLRVLLDPGSQTSFITEEAAQTLGLPKTKACVNISGVGSTGAGTCHSKINVEMKPRVPSNFTMQCELLVLKKLTSSLPTESSKEIQVSEFDNCLLADPTYNVPGPINIIIGADIFPMIVREGMKKSQRGYLAQNTELGWVISGKLKLSTEHTSKAFSMISIAEEKADLTRFWELEEIQPYRKWTSEEMECENFYKATTVKTSDSKYTVKLPLKGNVNELGESRKKAMARLLQMEKKFKTNETFHIRYKEFMDEYKNLGHMVRVNPSSVKQITYYIPHHAVIKEDSSTTKLRVVFDASAKTSSGKSLNELMFIGPRVQENLSDILLRWRKYKVVLSADIEKMYRQIKIHESDQPLQTILWRPSPEVPIEEYHLTTVTYGTSSAPYLAVRTLQQLAHDKKIQFPTAAQVLCRDFYVDDLITGCDTVEEAKILQNDLISLLKKGNFKLRKWRSNCIDLIEQLPEDLQEQQFLEINEDETKKTLGVHWAPILDQFRYKVAVIDDDQPTKRKILSQVAKLYDPLGWLAPIIIVAKLLVQNLWINENKWDEPVPPPIGLKWHQFQQELPRVEAIKFPRWINYNNNIENFELHGFCDASEGAYGAVVYSKTVDKHGQISVNLLQAKSKVAPIKMRKTLPRLELCAAVLLSKLLIQISEALKIRSLKHYAWTDSTITLAWIQGRPDKWNNFVANRVAEINENIAVDDWYHVKSEENPADLVSRGMMPEQLLGNSLWWNGPSWLKQTMLPLDSRKNLTTTEEKRKHCVTCTTVTTNNLIITKIYSSLQKLIRIVAYCKRFINNCRNLRRSTSFLATEELHEAQSCVIQLVQLEHFPSEMSALKRNESISKKSPLLTLMPFLDENGIIRVGGRLQQAALSYNEKHPIIIPHNDSLAKLIVQDAHERTLHGGNQLTLALIRQKYWIPKGKSIIRQFINKCVKCFRARPTPAEQMMGNLPKCRINISPAFTHTGIDYAGPIQIRTSKGRGNKSYKGYIAVFVCMATKAIHLEAVSDMTTEAFLAALRRFQARRGHCTHLYSDNGTYFVGAKRVLDKELLAAMKHPSFQGSLTSSGTTWHFTPPAAPHFGGLWEAGVKSIKYHLKRVIGDSTLTFEELTTVLNQIEACLNSRPLCVVNDNPDDSILITPGHLLIGRSLVTLPDGVELQDNPNICTRWKVIQKLKRDFWKVWSGEYLHRLQQRYRWHTPKPNISIGDVVLLKDENLSSTRWPMARITKVFPGMDNKIRVVEVKTQEGSTFKRPLVKICPLPVEKEIDPNSDNLNRTRRRRTANVNVITCLALCLMNIISPVRPASYTVVNPSPGLYVEHIGDAILNRGILRLDIPINTTILDLHNQIINKTMGQYSQMCDRSKGLGVSSHCSEHVVELQQRYLDLKRQMHIIQHGYSLRRKRGLLGKVLTSVFGVNDEVYADLEKLDNNQKQLIQNSNHQTNIMLKTLSSLNSTENRITNKLNQFTNRLNHGLEQIAQSEYWYNRTDTNSILIQILSIYQLAEEVMRELENIHSKLLRVVHQQGHIIDFLTIGEYHKIKANITLQLPPHFKVVSQRMKRMELTTDENSMVLLVYFYIVETPKYTVINVTPVPQQVKSNVYMALQIEEPIIAIDYNNQHYFELKNTELHQETSVGPHEFLVSPHVIYDINSHPNCVIDTIYSRSTKNSCGQRKFSIERLLWKQLYIPNSWMFIATTPTRVNLRCNGELEDVWLNNTGIIQINQTCTLDTGKSILKTRVMTNIKGRSAFHKPLSINTTISYTTPPNKIKAQMEPNFEPHEDFASLLHDEQLLQEDLSSTSWATIKPHVTITSMGVATLLVIVAVVLSVIWWLKGRSSSRPTFMLPPQDVHS